MATFYLFASQHGGPKHTQTGFSTPFCWIPCLWHYDRASTMMKPVPTNIPRDYGMVVRCSVILGMTQRRTLSEGKQLAKTGRFTATGWCGIRRVYVAKSPNTGHPDRCRDGGAAEPYRHHWERGCPEPRASPGLKARPELRAVCRFEFLSVLPSDTARLLASFLSSNDDATSHRRKRSCSV